MSKKTRFFPAFLSLFKAEMFKIPRFRCQFFRKYLISFFHLSISSFLVSRLITVQNFGSFYTRTVLDSETKINPGTQAKAEQFATREAKTVGNSGESGSNRDSVSEINWRFQTKAVPNSGGQRNWPSHLWREQFATSWQKLFAVPCRKQLAISGEDKLTVLAKAVVEGSW